jgi:hypothetical protein
MKFQVSSELAYQVHSPSTLLINVHALRLPGQTIIEETFTIDPYIRVEELISAQYENRFIRLEVEEGNHIKISYTAVVDTMYKEVERAQLEAVPVGQLDGNVLPYLFPSRYCQSDKLGRMAYKKFGHIGNVYEKVLAIIERAGVCRDFAHLAIALCRALSIPARYFTGYSYKLKPSDFHACFEAYIGGQWLIFDATRLAPLNGLVKIANGRDAADASIASIFGNVSLAYMSVSCLSLEENFVAFTHQDYYNKGIALCTV